MTLPLGFRNLWKISFQVFFIFLWFSCHRGKKYFSRFSRLHFSKEEKKTFFTIFSSFWTHRDIFHREILFSGPLFHLFSVISNIDTVSTQQMLKMIHLLCFSGIRTHYLLVWVASLNRSLSTLASLDGCNEEKPWTNKTQQKRNNFDSCFSTFRKIRLISFYVSEDSLLPKGLKTPFCMRSRTAFVTY